MSRIAVIGQSALMRQLIAGALRSTGHSVLGSVHTLEALTRLVSRTPPDLVVAGPAANTREVRELLRTSGRIPLVSAPPLDGDGPDARDACAMSVVQAVHARVRRPSPGLAPRRMVASCLPAPHPLVVVGASTGGPQVLEELITGLPATTPPVVIVQHMPATQTARLAERLDGLCDMAVGEAQGGEVLARGQVWVAPGDRHLAMCRQGRKVVLEVRDTERVNGHRPSVTVLFRSLVGIGAGGSLAILLTGMGNDGADALLELRHAGAFTVTQDRASSAVYGMPRVAYELGASMIEGSPQTIRRHILNYPESR